MGIRGLKKIIEMFAKNSIIEDKFQDYKGNIYTIDSPIMIYKFCLALMNTNNYESNSGEIIAHLFACFFKSLSMIKYGIWPLWIFDGKPPSIKYNTLDQRKKNRDNVSKNYTENSNLTDDEKLKFKKKMFTITPKQIEEIKYVLFLMGVPYLQSPGEAEAQCAAFEIAKITNGVVTQDTDVILYGCKSMLYEFSNKNVVKRIEINELLKSLGITRDQFIDLGAILGNDYCKGINGLNSIKAFELFKESNFNMYEFLEKIYKNPDYEIPYNFLENWKESKNYYLHAPVIKPDEINLSWQKPNFNKLYEYLVEIKGFNKELITDKIEELRLLYNYYIKNNNCLVTMSRIRKELEKN